MTTRPRSTGLPARGYSWPAFTEGNEAALKHGAYSADVPEVAAPRAANLAAAAPWLEVPAFTGTARDVAIAEVMVERLFAAVIEGGVTDEDGKVRGVVGQLDRYLGRVSKLRHEAGLTPLGMADMLERLSKVEGSAAADAVEALKEAGRAIRQAAEARGLPAPPGAESDEGGEVTP